ncbi:MAG: nicotinamide mononucleotide transporter [Clostridia bacterium]|nr:nicotinamide mononucleotide transporter [Clostridia bacterium]
MAQWFGSVLAWWCEPWNLLSGIVSVIALVGTLMNAERNKWGFAFWLVSNLYFAIRFFVIGEYAQSALFFAYFVLAFRGVLSWTQKEENDKKAVEKAAATGIVDFEESN